MPYHIEKQGRKWCVCKGKTSGATVKCHPTKAEATKHLAALYVNVPDLKKGDDVSRIARRVPIEDAEFVIEGEVSKADTEKRIVFGWAYVTHDKDGTQVVDKSGEFVSDPEELEGAAYNFVLNSRVGKDFHGLTKDDDSELPGIGAEFPAAQLVESFVFTKDKREALGIPDGVLPTGWWVGFKIYDEKLWNLYKTGERKMFSVHGKGKARRIGAA